MLPVTGTLEQVLSRLLPLSGGEKKIHNTARSIYAANDGGRWVFGHSGEPFPFEQVERYQERRVRDRFTFEMLQDYLRYLGLSPFEEDFYMPPGSRAWLVQKTGPATTAGREYTLEEVRATRVL